MSRWRTIIDFTKIKKGGVPPEEILKALDEPHPATKKGTKK